MSKYLTFVAVGDRDSRKTDLLLKYTGDNFHKYSNLIVPKFRNNIHTIIVDRAQKTVHFMDTESDDDFRILRTEAYEKADCVLMCYSVKVKSTFQNVYKKWCLEVRKYAPFVPIILVGTDIEARSNNTAAISTEQGENLKLLIGAYAFVECSIEHFLGVDDIFIEAVRSTYKR